MGSIIMKHEIKDLFDTKLAELKQDNEMCYIEIHDIIDSMDYSGALHEIIDNQIDIYYYDLRQWAVDNWEYCEEAINEGLTDGSDYHAMIQAGQYVYYQEKAYEYIEILFINEEV